MASRLIICIFDPNLIAPRKHLSICDLYSCSEQVDNAGASSEAVDEDNLMALNNVDPSAWGKLKGFYSGFSPIKGYTRMRK